MRSHPGGYGMYYHMDMHGGPHSFEWVGATYLPKVWEEMTAAYEYGVREIWVTNIGDIGTQEFGLSYFLDLAYDIDVWGGQDAAITTQYTAQWVRRNFGAAFAPADLPRIEGIITDGQFDEDVDPDRAQPSVRQTEPRCRQPAGR